MSTQRLFQFLFAAFIAIFAQASFAQNVHYKRGPTCTAGELTVTCSGSIAGVGNGAITVVADFPNATATTICTSPGGNESPGQNPATPVPVSGSVTLPPAPKNGTQAFSVTTIAPQQPTSEQAGCPNPNWTASIDTINFGTGTLTFFQNGAVVLGPTSVTPR